jgi:bacteriocin-like protein
LVDTQALELSDAELENVSGGFLENAAAKCEISGGLNLLSSDVAIGLG